MASKNQHWISDIILIIIIALLAFATYGVSPLLTPDEGRYAEIAREMLSSGHFLIPHLNGIPYFEKPPLVYWLTASSMWLFGFNEWAARLWCLIFYALNLVYCYSVIRLTYCRRLAWYSVAVLGSALLFLLVSHMLTIDFGLTFFMNAALLTMWLAIRYFTEKKQARFCFAVISYVLIGAAVMCKGFVGLALPYAIIGLWLILQGRWRLMVKLNPILGLIIIAMICAPWLYLVQRQYPAFLHFYVWTQQFARYFTPIAQRSRTRAYYPLLVWLLIFPWSAYWLDIISKGKMLWRNYSYFITWGGLIIVFFAFSHSLLIPYLAPAAMPVAILVAACLHQDGHKKIKHKPVNFTVTLLSTLLVCLAIVLLVNAHHIVVTSAIWAMLVISLLALLLCIAAPFIGLNAKGFYTLYAILFVLLMNVLFTDTANLQQRSVKTLAQFILAEQQQQSNSQVYSFINYSQDFPYYLQQPVLLLKKSLPREMKFGYAQHPVGSPVVSKKQFISHWLSNKTIYALVQNQDMQSLQQLFKPSQYCELKKVYHYAVVVNHAC